MHAYLHIHTRFTYTYAQLLCTHTHTQTFTYIHIRTSTLIRFCRAHEDMIEIHSSQAAPELKRCVVNVHGTPRVALESHRTFEKNISCCVKTRICHIHQQVPHVHLLSFATLDAEEREIEEREARERQEAREARDKRQADRTDRTDRADRGAKLCHVDFSDVDTS